MIEFFDSEDDAIDCCRSLNADLDSPSSLCHVVIEGPDDNWAVVDLETARGILDESDLARLLSPNQKESE
jgi:hypothetical protein